MDQAAQRLDGAVRSGVPDAVRTDDLFELAEHDIKNALNVVNSALDMIADDPKEMADMLPLLRRSSGRIGRLVATLVEVNRLVGGTMPVRIADVPWARLCESALADVALLAEGRAVTVDVRADSGLVVRCDRALFERVLTNLLDHVVAAAPRSSVVDVHVARSDDGGFRALVGHRGTPLAADQLANTKRLRGWGLGMIFCRLAVERHGGTICPVSPYHGDAGVAFEIALPA
jgi:signal transduction histidine kinase